MRSLVFILLFFILAVSAHPRSNSVTTSDDGKSVCLQCTAAQGLCSNTCRGYVCVKSVEHQNGSARRYCVNALEPGQPRPGECKNFQNELGHSETVCACTGDYCNSASDKSLKSAVRYLMIFSILFSFFPQLNVQV